MNMPVEKLTTAIDHHVLLKKVILLAAHIFSKYYHCDADSCIDSKSHTDFACQAIAKYRDGTRAKADDKDVLDFLYGVLKSDISHAWKRQWKLQSIDFPENLVADEAISVEDQLIFEQIIIMFLRHIKDQYPLLLPMAKLMLFEGLSKPQEIAISLDLPIAQINNHKKTFSRAITSFQSCHPGTFENIRYDLFQQSKANSIHRC